MQQTLKNSTITWKTFLIDIFICSLGAFGGPEAHYSVFTDQLVTKKQYLTEEELVELIALCSFLPGPSSTQTIVAIGHKTGGPLLAFLTMLVWAFPALVIMTILSFLYQFLDMQDISTDILRYIGPMAVGFIIVASYRIGKKVIKDQLTLGLLVFGATTTYFIRDPWIFPLVLTIGGLVSVFASKEKQLWNRVALKPPYGYLALFLFFTGISLILATVFQNELIHIFERFYRYGYLVFGGGQVIIPVMYSELVEVNQLMSSQEFLTGYGLVQGIPGPMFSFSAYAGGLSVQADSAFLQVLGAIAGGIGIFLPGLLLIYFVYPMWASIKNIKGFKIALKGVAAVAGGLIAIAAVLLTQQSGLSWDNLLITITTVLLLITRKIPAPIIVLIVLSIGFFF
ncbi:chromate efflux transporter [Marinilactibacillus sp. Marseille-P9653]|uniref:chromate efflux transporter n=1 Tax=Marinilactibacillus sp. Marseille-P9653 TaxID=2866583 RepID=UPI001CE41B42|nr:chromate efflux transporter [Marinilactibacillus sp. Marseille-P9653]